MLVQASLFFPSRLAPQAENIRRDHPPALTDGSLEVSRRDTFNPSS